MKTSLKLLIAGLSALGFGFGATMPSMAQSQMQTPKPNAETTPVNTPERPAPTDRDTGVSPVQSPRDSGSGSNAPVQSAPSSNEPASSDRTPSNNQTPSGEQRTPGTVTPANLPTGTPAPSGTSAPSYSFSGSEKQSIDQIVRTSPSFELFNALLRVAESEGILKGQLAGSSSYTVFAPTDEALAAIPPATFKALVQPENRALLAQVLENHIVQGKVSSSDLATKPVKALNGNTLSVQGGMIGNARVVGADIQADNGIIHAVDQAILPADLQSKLTSLAPMGRSAQ